MIYNTIDTTIFSSTYISLQKVAAASILWPAMVGFKIVWQNGLVKA